MPVSPIPRRLLQKLGFELTATTTAFAENERPPYRGQLLCYRRGFQP